MAISSSKIMRHFIAVALFVSLAAFGSVLRPANVAMHWAPEAPDVSGLGAPDHWWKFTESTGTAVEDYGDATDIDGTLYGSTAGSSHTWKPTEDMGGKWTGALEQIANLTSGDTSSARRVVLDSNPDFDGLTKVTLCAWVNKYSSGTQSSDQRIFSQADSWSEDDHVFMFGYTNGDTLRMRIRDSSGSTTTKVFSTGTTDNTDTHLCLVVDLTLSGDEVTIYKDGASVETQDLSGSQIYDDVDGTLYTAIIAQKAPVAWSYPFLGLVADVRLWLGEAATASDVSAIYNNTF